MSAESRLFDLDVPPDAARVIAPPSDDRTAEDDSLRLLAWRVIFGVEFIALLAVISAVVRTCS